MSTYQNAVVDGFEIFYREAGSKDRPAILLFHGFPTSSHMFRNLIPALADRYHLGESAFQGASLLLPSARRFISLLRGWPRRYSCWEAGG